MLFQRLKALMTNPAHIGRRAERQACRFLQKRGLRLLHKNYRCQAGEIDLIMQDQDERVFVEVRYRRQQNFGGALASVTQKKQKRIGQAAKHYLMTHDYQGACRFDVLALDAKKAPEWIQNAFTVQ